MKTQAHYRTGRIGALLAMVLLAAHGTPAATGGTNGLAAPGTGRQGLSVLFIGNSYSFELPNVFASLASAAGKRVRVAQATSGGFTLQQHLTAGDAVQKLGAGGWDVVVLQEQSQVASFPEAQVRRDLDPALTQWKKRVAEVGAKPVLFGTWAKTAGDRQNAPQDTFDRMHARLNATFRRLQREQAMAVVPVGAAWAAVRKSQPGLALHAPDGSHPGPAGVYLTASVSYAALFEKSPSKLGAIQGVDAATAAVLRRAAEEAVLNWRNQSKQDRPGRTSP
jgi:hypothetical protein